MFSHIEEVKNRVEFIKVLLKESGASGIVYGNSGGKDCALVGILCKMACENTLGVIMPCSSKRNYNEDMQDALALAEKFSIKTEILDLSSVKNSLTEELSKITALSAGAESNIPPRLRMTALYAIAGSNNLLVAGTGNLSERYMGYFTKWGDGACDFNPIGDLTVTEVYSMLKHLGAPEQIINKAPSAGLFDGQTDEGEMGITYAKIDDFIKTGSASPSDRQIIEKYHKSSAHKRKLPPVYGD